MRLQIKILTPVHIGNGEKYNGLSYLQDKREKPFKLCYLEFDRIKQVLTDQQLQIFADWITTENYPAIQKFLQYKLNDRNNNIANQLISASVYKIDLFFVENYSQRKFLGRIESFIKQNNKVYIPGSEIKGAIRTAILYKLLKENNNLYMWLKNEIEDFGKRFRSEINKVKDKRLEKYMKEKRIKEKILVKEMGKIEEELQRKVFRTNNDDAKYDLLKLLSISDSDSKKPDECLFVSNLQTLNISRQFPIFQELLKPDQTFTCERFEINNNSLLLDKLGFSPEQKYILSSPQSIFGCCYEFTNRLLDEEIAYFNSHKPETVKKLENIKKQNQKDSPVIRIGKNEGYLSLTIGLLIKEKDPDLYNNVVIHATKNTSYTNEFPKTRRIVNLGKNNWDTLGWVKLKFIQ